MIQALQFEELSHRKLYRKVGSGSPPRVTAAGYKFVQYPDVYEGISSSKMYTRVSAAINTVDPVE